MTLIITVATPLLIVQAGDRLLTKQLKGKIQQFDEKSNKSLIYEAWNGALAISYCGKAFIRGRPTDEWIAEQLNSKIIIPTDGSDPWSLQMGSTSLHDLLTFDGVIKVLREKTSELPALEFLSHSLTIVVTGWKQKRDRIQNTIIEITRKRNSTTAEKPIGVKRLDRLKTSFFMDLVGSGHRPETESYLNAALRGVSLYKQKALPKSEAEYLTFAGEMREALAMTIKFASTIEKTVGANVHTTTFYQPFYRYPLLAETHFFSDMPHPATIITPTRTIEVHDAAVTGWTLFGAAVSAPSYLVGPTTLQGRFMTLEMNGAPPIDNVKGFFTTIPRRRV
ncbi:hypothetical protein [Pseudomonas atacamensis]|uniref:Uncharacterized protein n=1 Tax=Pseudomonas iranensis TaxID=2745503 RepID=A0AAU7EYY5_9PSED